MSEKEKKSTLGAYIRAARGAKRLSLEELSERAGVSVKNLASLEQGDITALPPAAYMEGILQKVAGALDVDPKELMKRYHRRLEAGSSSASGGGLRSMGESAGRPPANGARWQIITPRRAYIFGMLFVVGAALLYVGFTLQPMFRSPQLVVESPAHDIAVEVPEVLVTGLTHPGNDLTVNREPVYLDEEGRFTMTLFLHSGVNIVEVISQNRFGNVSKVRRHVVYTPK